MKTKAEKRNQARKVAEAQKAAKKAVRQAKGVTTVATLGKKGQSRVPQSKTRK